MSEIDRRNFLRFMLAGGAATMLGCQRPMSEKLLLSYVDPPEELIPGKPLYYASVCRECPAGCGVLACARDGRVVKVEGNPNHPVNQGTLCARGQAALQGLYDPDRVTRPLVRSSSGNLEPTTWEDALGRLGRELSRLRPGDPARLVFLSGILGPSLQALAEQWLHLLGGGRLIQYEVLGYEAVKAANRISFGREEVPHYRLDRAKFILSFGVDFLETWLSPVEFSRGFAATRTYRAGEMGLHVQVEPRLSLTGANADEWIAIKPGTEYVLALGLVHVLIQQRLLPAADSESLQRIFARVRAFDPARVARETGVAPDVVPRLARAFAVERPSLALSGAISSEARNATVTQVAVNLLNYVAGNVGETVIFGAECYPGGLGRYQEVRDLVEAMKQGRVGALLVHQSDPLFTMPTAAGFEEALEKVPLVVALTSFLDETAARAHLVLPVHVPLEAWDDYSPRKGILGLQQPAMRPLHDTRHVGDLLLELARQVAPATAALPWKDFYEYLRDRWKDLRRQERPEMDFELFWKNAVMGGGVWKEFPPETVQLLPGALAASFQDPTFDGAGGDAFALIAYPSPLWYDGRGANKSWLQEIPHPLSHIVWDNWVEMHPEAARRLSLGEGDVVLLRSPHGEVRLPVHLHRWMRPDTVAVPFGQGHSHYGRNARNRGANPISLLAPGPEGISGGLPWLSARVTVQKTGQRYPLVSTQGGPSQDERRIAQSISLTALMHGAEEVARPETHLAKADLYGEHPHPDHRWGMVIDLNACIGCNACVAACYAENNIPIVGKDQVGRGREMSWIRIEQYVEDAPSPRFNFLPMLCQQCDNAPCETVCPAYATYHNPEGLNAQIYNRCVGTFYCSNNCPYKVRRFNWFTFEFPEPLNRQLNPNVTVREMGVMEKCTFCVQRIVEAKHRAKDEGRVIWDGEIVPACAQTCPTSAIVFGDLKDPRSHVSERSQDPRGYRILEHLNAKPAVTYLKRIRRSSEGA